MGELGAGGVGEDVVDEKGGRSSLCTLATHRLEERGVGELGAVGVGEERKETPGEEGAGERGGGLKEGGGKDNNIVFKNATSDSNLLTLMSRDFSACSNLHSVPK